MPISDKISNLPDAVICHILSFLPTKLAAATSVLSKRWTPLWLSVPTLHLVEKSHGELDLNQSIQFLRMVYSVMLKRDVTRIQTFSLKICGHTLCDASDVSTWINSAIHRGIESLHLDLLPSIRLPSGTIGSKTLVYLCFFHLTINGVFGDGFPSLKAMHLMSIHFEQHRDLMHLLSGCPILEDLYAEGLTLNNDELISVEEFQSIHNLVRVDVSFAATYIPFRCLCNAKTLSLMEWFPNYEVACTFHNLTSLELMVGSYNWHWFFKLLHHCPKLQNFKIVKVNVWLLSLPTGSITTWVELTRRFLAKYLPPANFSKLRTDYLMMPVADILVDSIAMPGVEAKNFEINPDLISGSLHFGGLPSENPILHLTKFLMFTDILKYDGVPTYIIYLMLFRSKWLSTTLPVGSITTWNELTHQFLAKYFTLEKSAKLRGDIFNFAQFEQESLYEAWEHFRDLIGKCPNHGLSICLQVEIFYYGISYTNKLLIDAACIFIKTPKEAYSLIEEMANNSNQWQ